MTAEEYELQINLKIYSKKYLVLEAFRAGEKEGQEVMRERAAKEADENHAKFVADKIRDLEIA